MINPITGNRTYLLAYILIWVIIAIIQMILIKVFFRIEIGPAFADSLIVNLLHAVTGLAIWFPVRFNPLSAKNIINPLIAIFVTGIVTVSFWVGMSFFILKSIFPGNEDYLLFLHISIPNRIITDFLLYIVLVLVYSLIIYNINLKERLSNEANLKTLVREAELNMLKAQINPHFLFNALNSISLLTKKDPAKAREMIIKLSDYLRYSLRYGDDSMTTLLEEMENMERYLEIEKVRFGEKLLFKRDIQDSALSCRIPNMILQPIMENAIKHGVYESIEPIAIEISAEITGNELSVTVENEFDPENVPRKGAGIGLKNITSRLLLIYGRDDLLNYKKNDSKFYVYIKIPQVNRLE